LITYNDITKTCAKIDKSGLATVNIPFQEFVNGDLLTVLFVCMAVSVFSVRKSFTLESQQHGALDDLLEYLLNLCSTQPTTNWSWIATIHPVERVMKNLSKDTAVQLLASWLNLQIPVAKFLEIQWKLGVAVCANKSN
jgi:hypothetical protein